MVPIQAEQQAKLVSLFKETLGQDEYTKLLSGEPSIQKYLDAGKQVSFESILPLLRISGSAQFTPDQENRYWSALQTALVSNEETDWQQIVDDTVAAIKDYRNRKNDARNRIFALVDNATYDKEVRVHWRTSYLQYNTSFTAAALSFLTEDFDVTLIPYCANEEVPVWMRKRAIARVINDADNKEEVSNLIASYWNTLIADFRKAMAEAKPRSASVSDSDTSYPRLTCYNVEQLLTPDISSATWPLQMATSFSGHDSTRRKISGLLAIGTEQAKISSLILSAAEHARQQKKSNPSINELTLAEAVAVVEGYLRDMRAFWQFRSSDFHAIYRWLEDGAALVEVPEVLRWWLENDEKNHLYRTIAMQLRGYFKIHSEFYPGSSIPEGEPPAKDKPVVTIEDKVIKVDGKIITDEQLRENIEKLGEVIGKI